MKLPSPIAANPIGLRLKLEMKKRGITSGELAKRADVKTSFIYDVISGKSANPSTIKLARVATALRVDLAWLAGSAAIPRTEAAMSENYVAIRRIMVESSAGGALVSSEEPGEFCHFRESWIRDHLHATASDLRLLSVRGDSMEPTLCHNDIILIDTTRKTPSPPGIFVLFDGFGLTPKRLEYIDRPMRLRVISDNPQYSTYERGIEEISIIGRVAWFAREM
ncbi:MAG: LexA family transcriptional regulator [Pseudomonadota bacterium]|nr:LexA family transcriptional regulator [Pseudomonadota bacterium]MDE3037763.1 LexA family transcriptional regulator [Pseudomonadota bacterium]